MARWMETGPCLQEDDHRDHQGQQQVRSAENRMALRGDNQAYRPDRTRTRRARDASGTSATHPRYVDARSLKRNRLQASIAPDA